VKLKLQALRISYSILLFLLIINITFAQLTDGIEKLREEAGKLLVSNTICPQATLTSLDLVNIGLVFIIIYILIGFIIYLLSHAFSSEKAEALVKAIYLEDILTTIFIYVIVIFLFTSLSVQTPNGSRYIYAESASKYTELMFSKGIVTLSLTAFFVEFIKIISYIQYPIVIGKSETGFHMHVAIGQLAKPIIDTFSILIPFLNAAVSTWAGMYLLLCFTLVSFSYFLLCSM